MLRRFRMFFDWILSESQTKAQAHAAFSFCQGIVTIKGNGAELESHAACSTESAQRIILLEGIGQ